MSGQGKRSYAERPKQRSQEVPDARIAYLCTPGKTPPPAWLSDPALLPKRPPQAKREGQS